MDDLKECAHCGGKAKADTDSYGNGYVICEECGAQTSGDHSLIDAIAAWNRRAVPQANAEQDALEAGRIATIKAALMAADQSMIHLIPASSSRDSASINHARCALASAISTIDAVIRAASKTTPSSAEGGNG